MERLINDLFGDESDDEGKQLISPLQVSRSQAIPGLSLVGGFLSGPAIDFYIDQVKEELSDGSNQKMAFGSLPLWATRLADLIMQKLSSDAKCTLLLPGSILERSPLFNQMIINSYQPGEGIRPHVDLERFEDGIAVMSLGGPAIMNFTPCQLQSDEVDGKEVRHQVLLCPGDLLLMHGEARWKWRHGIDHLKTETYFSAAGEMPKLDSDVFVQRAHRLSVTLRKLAPDIVLTESAA